MSAQPGFSGAPLHQPPLDDDGIDLNNNDPNNNIEFNEAEAEMSERNNEEDIQITLLNEARSIHAILMHFSIEEIYSYLEASIDHPNRVTVVTDMFLARDIPQDRTDKVLKRPPSSAGSSPPRVKSSKNSNDFNSTVVIDSDDDDFLEDDTLDRSGTIYLSESDSNNSNNSASQPTSPAQQQEPIIPIPVITFTEASQDGESETVRNNLGTLAEMFPTMDKDVLKDMYMQIYPIEGERTLDVLVMQMLDVQDGGQAGGDANVGPVPLVVRTEPRAGPQDITEAENGPSSRKKAKIAPPADKLAAAATTSAGPSQVVVPGSSSGSSHADKAVAGSSSTEAGPNKAQDTKSEAEPSKTPANEAVAGPSNQIDEVDANGDSEQLPQEVNIQLTYLLGVLPEADPSFLKHKCIELQDKPEEMRAFIMDALEKHDYPTLEQYKKNKEAEEVMNKFTGRLSVKEFLKSFPDPETHFKSKTNSEAEYYDRCLTYLKTRFKYTGVATIRKVLQHTKSLTLSVERLTNGEESSSAHRLKNARSAWDCRETASLPERPYLPFIQEVFFLDNRDNIQKHFKDQKEAEERQKIHKEIEFEKAKSRGELLTCGCCFDEECLCTDMSTCPEGHLFCKECIRRYAENEIGDGRTKFKCLESGCDLEFTLAVLQDVLATTTFSRLLQKKQSEEVAAANIEGLENCPFCDFSLIPSPDDKIFSCLNPECMKQSCRECKEPAHIPLRCDEVEKDEEVKARKFVEDRMTEALVRECWKCHKKFVKIDGCNKMTCTCGAKMCYLCRQPIKDYDHFNNGKCQLHTNNDEVHLRNVREEAEKALQELKAKNPEVKLKYDPTKGLPVAPPPGQNQNNAAMQHLFLQRARIVQIHQERVRQRQQHAANLHGRRAERARLELELIEMQLQRALQAPMMLNIPPHRAPPPPPPAPVYYGGGFNVVNFQDPFQHPPLDVGPVHQPPIQMAHQQQPPLQVAHQHQPPFQQQPPLQVAHQHQPPLQVAHQNQRPFPAVLQNQPPFLVEPRYPPFPFEQQNPPNQNQFVNYRNPNN